MQGRIQDFKLGGGSFKKIAPSGGRRENFWVFRVKNHDFTPKKKSYFFQFQGGGRVGGEGRRVRPPLDPPPAGSAPDMSNFSAISWREKVIFDKKKYTSILKDLNFHLANKYFKLVSSGRCTYSCKFCMYQIRIPIRHNKNKL